MASGQYQIPNTLSEGSFDPELIRDVESSFPPELVEQAERLGRYENIKQIESSIELLRQGADEATVPRYRLARLFRSVTSLLVTQRNPENLEKRLVDAESEIGGLMLQSIPGVISQRFWFHGGDWFYEAVDAQGAMYARYQFTNDEVYKLVNGLPTAFADNEVDALIGNVTSYLEHIRSELYGVDQALPVDQILKDDAQTAEEQEVLRKDDLGLAA